MMYQIIKPLLFALNPEASHDLTIALLERAGNCGLIEPLMPNRVDDPVDLMGLHFANRVGLAAGLDKNARCMRGMASLGFGFIEVGTVTPLPQSGNPRPRLFRLPEQQAIINRMGFNNEGLEALLGRVRRLQLKPLDIPLGINIGKNKHTSAERAVDDYLICLDAVTEHADYITVNLSSPNTPGLRDLQFGEPLDKLLAALAGRRTELADRLGVRPPMLVKLAPDMATEDLLVVADRLVHFGIDGVIATNTTIDRTLVQGSRFADEAGGLSGKVLFERSTETVKALSGHLQGAMTIIGVGGINSAENAAAKIQAGADLVQIYSGLIYQGPTLIGTAAQSIRALKQR